MNERLPFMLIKLTMFYIEELFKNNIYKRTPHLFHKKSYEITLKEHFFEMSLEIFTKTVIRNVLSS